MRAVRKFKSLLTRRRPYLLDSIFGKGARLVQPPLSMDRQASEDLHTHHKARSVDTHDRRPVEQALVREGVHRKLDSRVFEKEVPDREDGAVLKMPVKRKSGSQDHGGGGDEGKNSSNKREISAHPEAHRADGGPHPWEIGGQKDEHKGHAHDPLDEFYFLAVGPDGNSDKPPDPPIVSESPPAAEGDIYERAYHEEVERIRKSEGRDKMLYLTRRVEGKKEYQRDENMVGMDDARQEPSGLKKVLLRARRRHWGWAP